MQTFIVLGWIALGVAVTGLLVAVIVLRGEAVKAQRSLANASVQLATLHAAGAEFEPVRAQARLLAKKLDDAYAEDQQKVGWLDHQQQEIDWLRAELEKRPKVSRKTYKILTLGIKGTGKTSLTLKWSNPLVDLGALQGTKIERYERTVSHVARKDTITEHVFEIGDWGGEHIVDAQQELIMEEVHGLLIVVDLAGNDGKLDEARIDEQLSEFQPQALKYFFSPKTLASCKSAVLFINKCDVLAGTPAEAERSARALFGKLIHDLEQYQGQIDVRVFVGSASYGHNVHHLFSHFVERILPKNAYDVQLLQRMKQDAATETPPARLDQALPKAAAPTPSTLRLHGEQGASHEP